jgi:SAM-dependent methyltransferase
MTMKLPDVATMQALVKRRGELYIPESITRAIGDCITSDYGELEHEINHLKSQYAAYRNEDAPMVIEYNGQLTLDAYAVNYLPRNTLIPKILFLSYMELPELQELPNEINVLDLGSGTGGVAIGLLDLFQNDPFRGIKLKIHACEASEPSLQMQINLIKMILPKNYELYHSIIDFTSAANYGNTLSKLAPYHFIFCANLFTELPWNQIERLLLNVKDLLAPNGILLIADPPRIYTCKMTIQISNLLRGNGLSQFYPCPPNRQCSNDQCWTWLETEFKSPDVEVGGKTITVPNIFKTTWSIFSRLDTSIYSYLEKINPGLKWGCAVPYGDELSFSKVLDYSLCTNEKIKSFRRIRKEGLFIFDRNKVIRRGTVVGFTTEPFKCGCYWHPLY